jgi:hypothetical protein
MPLLHIAWLRFKPDVPADRIERHLAACRELVGKVPAVRDLQCGPNLSDRAAGMTHGIVVSLADYAALSAYLDHPAHVPVATRLKADVAELRVMDLQV